MFPFSETIEIEKGLSLNYSQVLEQIFPLLTEARQKKIQEVVAKRTFNCSVVLENIYDRGNVSAVMRSAEAMGFAQVHMISAIEKFKESQRTTAGADKWLEVKKWKSTSECIDQLKRQGKQIIATHLDASSVDISSIDFSRPSAIVLGNEKDGISAEMIERADARVILPMQGFVQSYNISVAGALCFYHIFRDRLIRQGQHGDLTLPQQQILQAHYALRTLDSSADILRNFKKKSSE